MSYEWCHLHSISWSAGQTFLCLAFLYFGRVFRRLDCLKYGAILLVYCLSIWQRSKDLFFRASIEIY
jgi:hypothetical protein